MSDIDDGRETVAELVAMRETFRDVRVCEALARVDAELARALAQLSPRERADVLAGLIDDGAAEVLGALLGSEWEGRLSADLATLDDHERRLAARSGRS